MPEHELDLFISHASEDKAVVRPLAAALERAGLTVWLDETTLVAGQSLSAAIDYGLANCRFGLVILSKNFFAKNWTKHELAGLRARQMNGQNIIIPVWHGIEFDDVLKFSPPLADMLALKTSSDIDELADKVMQIVNPGNNSRWLLAIAKDVGSGLENSEHRGIGFNYWPDGGLRTLYSKLTSFTSHRQFKRYSGLEIWLHGPHTDDQIDFHNPTDFGHYNPKFVEWLYNNLQSILARPLFVVSTKDLFSNRLTELSIIYYASHQYIFRNPHVRSALRDALIVPSDNGAPKHDYRDLSWTKDVDDGSAVMELMRRLDRLFDSNRASAAVSFWMRRFEDGTAEQFAKIIVLLLRTYEPATFANFNSSTNWSLVDFQGKEIFDYRDFQQTMAMLLDLIEKQEAP